jgi:hypothetical protein
MLANSQVRKGTLSPLKPAEILEEVAPSTAAKLILIPGLIAAPVEAGTGSPS